MYNKTLSLTMNVGIQVMAKVPNPNAGRPHFNSRRSGNNGLRMYYTSLSE